jgi:hypothetical protein
MSVLYVLTVVIGGIIISVPFTTLLVHSDLVSPIFAKKVIKGDTVEVVVNKRFKCVYEENGEFSKWNYVYDGKPAGYTYYSTHASVYSLVFYAKGDRDRGINLKSE